MGDLAGAGQAFETGASQTRALIRSRRRSMWLPIDIAWPGSFLRGARALSWK